MSPEGRAAALGQALPGHPPEPPPEKVGIFHLQDVRLEPSAFPLPCARWGSERGFGNEAKLGKRRWGEGDLVFVFASNYPPDLIA